MKKELTCVFMSGLLVSSLFASSVFAQTPNQTPVPLGEDLTLQKNVPAMPDGAFVPIKPLENPMPSYFSIVGTIVAETEQSIEVKYAQNDETVILKLSPSTFVIDAITGKPADLKNRKGDEVIGYYGPMQTASIPPQSNAIAVICNIPQDATAPRYAVVESIEKDNDSVKCLVDNGSLIVTITNDLSVSNFTTNEVVSVNDIKVGSQLVLWYDMVALSYPGQTTAKKVIVLGDLQMPTNIKLPLENKDMLDETNKTKGSLPVFPQTMGEKIAKEANAKLLQIQQKALEQAKENSAEEIFYSYKTYQYEQYSSIVVSTAITSGNTYSNDIVTFVFDNTQGKFVTLQDVLGINAYKIANGVIANKIANSQKDEYYTDENAFSGIEDEPSFYIDNKGYANIVFNKYSIAPGDMGTPTFGIPLNGVVNKTISTDQTFQKDGVTLIPLRTVAEALHYDVTWNNDTQTIVVSNESQKHTLTIGQNDYNGEALELAPQVLADRTYVPISYVELVLNACYEANDNNITFSKLVDILLN